MSFRRVALPAQFPGAILLFLRACGVTQHLTLAVERALPSAYLAIRVVLHQVEAAMMPSLARWAGANLSEPCLGQLLYRNSLVCLLDEDLILVASCYSALDCFP